MSILAPIAPAFNANPCDSWPAWTEGGRWALGPETDDFRPTAGPDYIPTPDEEAEAAELLDGTGDDHDFEVRTDAEWEAMAEDVAAMDAVCSGLSWL